MANKAFFPILTLICLAPCLCLAQKENNVWYFGNLAGLDFNDSPPRVITDAAITANEGCTSIADRNTGQLLFYTNGETVWNRQSKPMSNGTNLRGSINSTQSALIIPVPNDTSKYYIFTTSTPYSRLPTYGLNYSVVDMSENGGLGDVTGKNVNLLPVTDERLVGIRNCDDRDYWVITHSLFGSRFYVYSVTSFGVTLVNTFDLGHPEDTSYNYETGYLIASPDRTKLAMALDRDALLQLFSFDPQSGSIGNSLIIPIPLAGDEGFYGLSFSPDNTKLYGANGAIFQLDVSKWDTASILASWTPIYFGYETGGDYSGRLMGLQLAPDGKIYVSPQDRNWVDVIQHPNASGLACGFVDSAIILGNGRCVWGLPNMIDSRYDSSGCDRPVAMFGKIDTEICQGECIEVHDSSANNALHLNWTFEGGTPASANSQSPGTVCFELPGLHRVRLIASNSGGADTTTEYVLVKPALDTSSQVNIIASDVAGAPGDTIILKIAINRSQDGKDSYENLSFQIVSPFSLLKLLDTSWSVISDSIEQVLIVHLNINPTKDTALNIPFIVSSGEIDSSKISIQNVRWTNACVGLVSATSSNFLLQNVYSKYGHRYVKDRSIVLRIYPNPSNGIFSMDFEPNEEGATTLFISDILGRRVSTILSGEVQLGRYTLPCNLAGFATGMYNYTLQSPSSRITGKFAIVK